MTSVPAVAATGRAAATAPPVASAGRGGPVFVGGQERSGTSLIYALLGSHPNLSMTRRTNWWTFFDGHFGDLADDADLDRCLDAMMRYRRHLKLEPDAERLRRDFVAGPRTYGRLLELLERQRAERLGKPRWGDKSLHTERYADRVFDAFPDARIIHMVRDPRDRYASALRRWDGGLGGVGAATAMWNRSVDHGNRQQARHPGRYLVVRYEDLATDPEGSLRRICAMIGEPFRPEMLGMDADPDFREAGNSSYGTIPAGVISTSSIGRYVDVLAPWQVRYIQERAGDRMHTLGYRVPDVTVPPAWRVRYRAWWRPSSLARAGAWRVHQGVLDVIGRSPSRHTLVARRRAGDR